MAQKQTIEIQITRTDWRKLKLPWLSKVISEALMESSDIIRLEVKEVKNK